VRLFGLTISRARARPAATLTATHCPIRRDYDAALSDRLFSDWKLTVGYSPTVLATQYPVMVARTRTEFKNNPYCRRIISLYRQNIVGHTGMLFRPVPADPDGRIDTGAAAILWTEFVDQWGANPANVDAAGLLNFRALCEAVTIGVVRDGNAYVRLLPGWSDNPHRFAVQLLPATGLDTALNVDDGTRRVYNGVEVDAWRRPVRYWFRRPSSADRLNPLPVQYVSGDHQVFPASEILHVFDRAEEPEATIGVPWLYSVLTRLKMLGEYEFAELVAAREDACSTTSYEVAPGADMDADAALRSYREGQENIRQLEPGESEILPPGVRKVKHAPTRPNGEVNNFRKGMLQGISSGSGPQYNSLANDLEGVNFSSIRTGKMDERDGYMLVQQLVIEQLATPLYLAWLDAFLMSGASGLPYAKRAKFAAHQFRGRRWPWVDPKSDAEYNELCRKYGWKTDDAIAGEIGEDWESNAAAIKAAAPDAAGTYLEQNYARQQAQPAKPAGKPAA
jgi:lambda family phage portal protein